MDANTLYSWGLSVGSFRGIRIKIHWTLLAMWLFELHGFLRIRREAEEAGFEGPETRILLLAWLAWTAAIGVSILLHEFGHAFAARALGGDAEEVLLWPLGGLALCRAPNVPRAQFLLAAGGPLASVAVTAVAWLSFLVLDRVAPAFTAHVVVDVCRDALIFWNMIILVFNLIPLYPFDGGRMFQTGLWGYLHRRSERGWSSTAFARASLITVYTSRVVAVLAALYFLIEMLRGRGSAIGILLILFAFLEIERLRMRVAEGAEEDSFMGYDFSQGYTSLGDRQEPVRDKSSRRRRRGVAGALRGVFGDPARRRARRVEKERAARERVDELLAKITRDGMASLTPAERRFLERASRRQRGG